MEKLSLKLSRKGILREECDGLVIFMVGDSQKLVLNITFLSGAYSGIPKVK